MLCWPTKFTSISGRNHQTTSSPHTFCKISIAQNKHARSCINCKKYLLDKNCAALRWWLVLNQSFLLSYTKRVEIHGTTIAAIYLSIGGQLPLGDTTIQTHDWRENFLLILKTTNQLDPSWLAWRLLITVFSGNTSKQNGCSHPLGLILARTSYDLDFDQSIESWQFLSCNYHVSAKKHHVASKIHRDNG